MTKDVYDPLARYRAEFRQKFSDLAHGKFEELTRESKVDTDTNRALVKEIKDLQLEADSVRARKRRNFLVALLGFVVAVASAVAAFSGGADAKTCFLYVAGIAAGLVLGGAMIPRWKAAAKTLSGLETGIASKKKSAWSQMEPLNRLFTRGMEFDLMEKTVPGLAFDPIFTSGKLDAIGRLYGWDGSFNDGRSIISVKAGSLDGNPFVFGHCLEMEWGEKTYEGTKTISWTEWEEDSNGKKRLVTRRETLRARVTKPVPVYSERKFLVYCNDSAPNLSFSRQPSGLTGKDGSFLGSIRKKWRLSRLKAFSRNLTDESNFTLMGNEEFETWFHAKDRDDEVEFRLMFTPVAQTQMMNLMKDKEEGFGDDFAFLKFKKINVFFPNHLKNTDIVLDLSSLHNWDYDAAAGDFVSFCERRFRDFFFALAPAMSIPLYMQTPPPEGAAGDMGTALSFWECEAAANRCGEDAFKHSDCITRSILKTRNLESGDGEITVEVVAHGYRGEERVECKNVYGRDGRYHEVAVHWTKYLPVEGRRVIRLNAQGLPS